ncbi:hypothetical protein GCM10011509_25120 [Ornithinimicrobium pekingense]|uniref:Uncharacterized protein n=2 Tax=Ornithinimicrobium pekingense TaxID=384677 RepID=A0ABQ2FAV8_9MICO|nr:hypothetical protein GCM10011509_25120 [Ornithinimicrobium pekingense]
MDDDTDTGNGPTTGTEDAPEGTSEATAGGTQQVLTAGALLTNGDSGAVVRLAPGEEVVLRLTPPLQGGTPQVSDAEVLEVVPVQHFADPGYAEFELLAQAAGRARVEVRGAGADGPVLLLLVEVQGR